MANGKILTILAACWLLAQVTWAKPTATTQDHFKDYDVCKLKTSYTELAPSEKDNELPATLQLMKVIMFELQDFSLGQLNQIKKIVQQLLKEPVLRSKEPTAEILKFQRKMQEFERKYSECDEMDELFALVELFTNATETYYEMETKGSLTADARVILDILKKYHIKEMNDASDTKFLDSFLANFGQKIEQLRETLRTEEGEMGANILQWWQKVKVLKTSEALMEELKEFMKIYGAEGSAEVETDKNVKEEEKN